MRGLRVGLGVGVRGSVRGGGSIYRGRGRGRGRVTTIRGTVRVSTCVGPHVDLVSLVAVVSEGPEQGIDSLDHGEVEHGVGPERFRY